MADPANIGTNWSDVELDLIVADYFAMLEAELAGRSYVKRAHRMALMSRLERSNRSVEFKHMNISAVLRELGMPWITGYKPKENYQGAIFAAIDRYLSANPTAFTIAPLPAQALTEPPNLFVDSPPALVARKAARPQALERLIAKFDPVDRDFRNRALGRAGEELVLEHERRRLHGLDRRDLARRIRWVSQEDGDGAGYDIRSFEPSGGERLIEVKTTCGAGTTPFYITRNELAVAAERPAAFRLYRVYQFSRQPRMFELTPPIEAAVHLEPSILRASFR